ncbi:MAG: isopeptide-forming domain-containing fimbrial protein [Clostridiales bacterium]|nr:isopeptide-forming domain-containing fimbrial protein [Clostridiales bacterium]
MRRNNRLSGVISFLAVFLLAAGFFALMPSRADAAANIRYLPQDTSIIGEDMKMNINRTTFKSLTSSGDILSLNKTSRKDAYVLRIKHPRADRDKGKTFTNAGVMKFENVGKINGRSIDASLTLSVYIGPRKAKNADETSTYIEIGRIRDGSVAFGGTYKKENTYPFHGLKYVTAAVNMTYHDTGKTVELPFYQLVNDLDMPGSTVSFKWYRESWKPVSGYTDYYVYKGHNLVIDSATPIFKSAEDAPDYKGEAERIRKAGVYGITSNGKFTSQYREGANAGAGFMVFSQYLPHPKGVQTEPEKRVNNVKEVTVRGGDAVNYTISFKGPAFMKNLVSPLSVIKITDTLEEGVTYKSASLTAGGTDLVKNGSCTISYDESSRKVTASVGSSWLNNLNNYKGQQFVLTIRCTADEPVEDKRRIYNTGYLDIGLGDTPSNRTVVNIARSYGVVYEYRSGTEDMELPGDISVSEGDYAIGDDNRYLTGDSVINRKDDKPETYEGSVYVVSDDSGSITGRWILSWDREMALCEGEDVRFIGTWTYVDSRKFKAHYYYRSDSSRNLPRQISTLEGNFAVKDETLYTDGSTVNRKEKPEVGTVYEVRSSRDVYMGKWILTEWDGDTRTVDGADVRFVGTWSYESAPKLVIEKRIKFTKEELNFAHGEPTFLYKISKGSKVRYEALTFDESSVEAVKAKGRYTDTDSGTAYNVKDGYISARRTVPVEPGTYVVRELNTCRYETDRAQAYLVRSASYDEEERTAVGSVGMYSLRVTLEDETILALYTNSKSDNEDFSHSGCCINALARGIEIPEEGYYTGWSGIEYIEGDTFPDPRNGDTFVYGEYTYTYRNGDEDSPAGWHVKANYTDREHYGEILEKVGAIPVVGMDGCFENCDDMTNSPAVPSGIITMEGAYRNCKSLVTAPEIPEGTVNMTEAFAGCVSLQGKLRITGEPGEYEDCFLNTAETILLCHSCGEELCSELIETANNGNVYCGMIPEEAVYYDKSQGKRLTGGDEFPDEAEQGDSYVLGDYEYRYGMNRSEELSDGEYTWENNELETWCVAVRDVNGESYSDMLTRVSSEPVEGLMYTYYKCENLRKAPGISPYAVTMTHAFDGCSLMTEGPDIPRSTSDLSYAFRGCVKLEKAPSYEK